MNTTKNVIYTPEFYKKKALNNELFNNLTNLNMSFEEVYNHIYNYMKADPMANYRLMLGSDSQVQRNKKRTVFITGIVIQRVGKGAWACFKKEIIPRKMTNIHERISYETSLTEAVAMLFTEDKKNELINIILPNIYKGSSFTIEGHLDIGTGKRNKTSEYINEMVSRIESMGLEAKIKPESVIASSYANRFTK